MIVALHALWIWVVAAVVFAILWALLRRWQKRHPCCNPGCSGSAWWRVFLILRAEKGEGVDMLARMPTPYRVCGGCFQALDPVTAFPDRALRRKVTKALLLKTGKRVDWIRTQTDREHVATAWLRRVAP